MYSSTARKLSNGLVRYGIIMEDDKEIYTVGYKSALTVATNILCVLMIGLLVHVFVESVVFIVSFYLLRICAGGYHVKSSYACFWISCAIEAIAVFGIANFTINSYQYVLASSMVMLIVCCMLCPVPNKKIVYTKKEAHFRRTLCLSVFAIEFALCNVFFVTQHYSTVSSIIFGWLMYIALNIMGHAQRFQK
jgi:accessory gene regulator B